MVHQRVIETMLDRRLSVAPMMDCTDRHFRAVARLLSPNALLYSEMVTTGALIHGDIERHLGHQADDPVALQLGGSDPAQLAHCARLGETAGYAEINLNVGCPSDRVQQGGIGACLMAQPELVADCYSAMAEAVAIPVTIKSRIGIDEMDSYEHFHHFIDVLYQRGCRVFIVHARKAILAGLTPAQNREVPPLHYDFVYRIAAEFSDASFTLNGGLKDLPSVLDVMHEPIDGVMLGRAVYQAPLLLAQLDQALFGSTPAPLDVVTRRIRDYVVQQLEAGTYLKHVGRHLLGLFAGMHGARRYRRVLSEHMPKKDAGIAVFDAAIAEIGEPREPPARLAV